jgi:tRNA synthetases class I (E and Q), anti-codon binding domain.
VNLDVDYARTKKLPIIQWAPAEEAVPAVVLMVKEGTLVEVKGVAEPGVTELKTGEHAQLYRFGFAILEDRRSFRFIYTHA